MATIDYKEKYEQALERARQFSEKPYFEDSAEIVEYIFPELKESKESKESERIRELLLRFVKYDMSDNYSDDFSKEDCLAWLEKQKVLTTEEDLQGKEDVLWCIKQAKKHAKDENEMGTCWFAERWLEKQGEKPVNRLKITAGNWYVCDMEVMNENMITAFHRGEVYYCPKDGYIDVNGALFEVGTLDVFRLATKEEIPHPLVYNNLM